MSSSQTAISCRGFALVVAVIASIVLFSSVPVASAAPSDPHASVASTATVAPCPGAAEEAVLSDPRANVFLCYGEDMITPSNGFHITTQIYVGAGGFQSTASHAYGFLKLSSTAPEVILKKAKGETITGIQAEYQLSRRGRLTNQLRFVFWSGRRPLPIYRMLGNSAADLVFAAVSLHSNGLSNQYVVGSVN